MSCRKIWSDDFVDSVYPIDFREGPLKKHKENLIFTGELAMMPDTMEHVVKLNKVSKIEDQINQLKNQIKKLKVDMNEITDINNTGVKKQKVLIVKECPNKKCNGYLDNKYTCGICDTKLCSKCEQINKEDHICSDDDIETVKLKKKECKYCPNCSKITYKDGGCFQVWCPPPCNGGKGTAWNFNTSEVEMGSVHAPLYYEYQRIMNNGVIPRVEGDYNDLNLEGYNYGHIMPGLFSLQKNIQKDDYTLLLHIHRILTHINNVLLREYYVPDNIDKFKENLDLRVAYLNKTKSEERIKLTLYTRDKTKRKNGEIYNNLFLLYNIGHDIFSNLFINKKVTTEFEELENIRQYYNEIMVNTKKRFGIKRLCIGKLNEKWEFSY
jgi:DNA-directed RNA polymerase subunit L